MLNYQTGPRAGQQRAAQRQLNERLRMAEDLARWASAEVQATHAEEHRHGTPCSDACWINAGESTARDMYQFALEIPMPKLRTRWLSELEERTVARARRAHA